MAALVTPVAGASEAKLAHDFKRATDHRHKYVLGVVDTGSKMVPDRPVRQRTTKLFKHQNAVFHRRYLDLNKSTGKHPVVFDTYADADVDIFASEGSVDPEPDADVAYSFDAQRGPSYGSEILSLAVNKAVERFENKETEKLVKNEYEVVPIEAEDQNEGYVADEEDFELL